jgi:RecB family exonuclease
MISPRRTRLVRATDPRGFQRAIFECLRADPDRERACAVIVPSRGAAEELQRTLTRFGSASASANPAIGGLVLTRDEFYEALRERLPGSPDALSPFDREVLLRRAARTARLTGAEPPFNLRAGLIREILALYDELRRSHRSVADFARLTIGTLEPVAAMDRGAARLLQQTRFLAAAFDQFEQTQGKAVDEHGIRALALASPSPLFRHVIVTVADQAADPRGLWTADFDLLARMPGLESIDVVATDALLEAGFHQRLHESLLPGIEDTRLPLPVSQLPVLLVPDADARSASYGTARPFTCRDREEELVEFVRLASDAARRGADLDRHAIVFQRPLPYLYLARQVFADARLPYQALDSLPLAAEPFAAAVDLIFAAIAAGFTRGALVELLRSPHFTFGDGGHALTMADVHALDRCLVKEKYLGGVERLRALAPPSVVAAVESLQAAAGAPTAPDQIGGLLAFIAGHERLPATDAPWYERHMRARAAVLSALDMLRRAHAQQDPEALSIAELSGAVRRWIEGQTFSPRTGSTGVRLLDAHAAPYADLDELRLVGLVESDWPERTPRSIFYPSSLLAQLGWPADQDRLSASRTRFQDLLRLPQCRVALSTFTLEEDAIVSPSPLLEDVDAAGLPVERLVARPDMATVPFVHETLMRDPRSAALAGEPGEWLSLRLSRAFDAPRFRGMTGPRAPSTYAVSKVERYLECPFKYFAAHVLKLPEERDEEAWMTPQERGHFVHEVFETFFSEWQRAGHGAITAANVGEALALFDEVAERRLETLPEGDRALERTLLLGSAAAAGFGDRAFAFEIDDDVAVVERLLEFELQGRFTFAGPDGPREVALRSKSDRIDLLADGTFRIVDYKIGRAPEKKRSLQLPIYGACAAQALKGRHGRAWTVGRAGYIAFKEKTPFVELLNPAKAIAEGEARLLEALEAIERGEFPVRPDEPFLCNWCQYPGVCRKDYVGDEFEP